MTIKQVQTNFNFDVDNQLLSCPYNIYTVNSSYPFLAEYKDNKPCWTCQRNASVTGFGIVFTTDITQVEFDLTVDNIDGFCVLVGINNTLSDGSSSRFHLVNVSKSYPSYGNYIWWNPDKAKIDDGVLDANKWVHMVIDKSSIKIYDLNSNLLYSRTKPEDIVDITLSSDENYQPYIANMTVTFNYSQNYLDTIGLTTLWSKIKSLFATKTELGSKANDSDVVHKSGDETIAGVKTFSDLQTISYGTQYKGNRNSYILPEFSAKYSGLCITTLSFDQTLKIGNFVLDDNNNPVLDTSKAYIQFATGKNNDVNACLIESRNSTSSALGTTTNKWKTLNGINPGALSLPDNSKLVTIDTTNWNIVGETNVYTPPANGWLHIRVAGATELMVRWTGWRFGDKRVSATATDLGVTIPVVAGVTVDVVTVASGFDGKCQFFPCQGNV